MNLLETISRIHELLEDGILFVEPIAGEFRHESRTVVWELSDSELSTPVASVAALRAPGTEYFLEVALVKEVNEGWQLAHPELSLNNPLTIQRVIYYAVLDA
jgi:hypothetical protein